MKTLVKLFAVSGLALLLCVSAYARSSNSFLSTFGQAAQQDDPAKTKMYEDFLAARKKYKDSETAKSPTWTDDYKAAYDLGKQYVDKYGSIDDEYTRYVKKFVADYENYQKVARKAKVLQLVNDKKYADAFTLGKDILSTEPNDLSTLFQLSRGALLATTLGNNSNFNTDATGYAKTALQLIDQGKTFQENTPIQDKAEIVALLDYAIGVFELKSSPDESITYLIKAAQTSNRLKTDATTYRTLAQPLEALYETVATDYKAKYPDATAQATPEGKIATDKVNALTDRLIDTYARVVAYAGTDPKYADMKKDSMDRLTVLYKYRHEGSDAGLQELIASVTSKPLPTSSMAEPATSNASKTASSSGK